MALFSKSVKFEDIFKIAKEKADQVRYVGNTITRHEMLQYIYQFYSGKRGQIDFHDVMDIVEKLYMTGQIKE